MTANFKKYVSMVLVVCMIIAIACFVGCNNNNHPQETTPETTANETTTQGKITTPEETTPENINSESTTPESTTPESTTPAGTTVAFPSDEDNDPKQEDVFFE